MPRVQGLAERAQKPDLGFIVAGYSSSAAMANEYQILVTGGECAPPLALREEDASGLTWNGQPEAISRRLLGYGSQLPLVLLEQLGVIYAYHDHRMAMSLAALAAAIGGSTIDGAEAVSKTYQGFWADAAQIGLDWNPI